MKRISVVDIAQAWFSLRKLHGELSYLYKTKSADHVRIALIWKTIEELEATLRDEGIDVA